MFKGTLTITGKLGPGLTLTTHVIPHIRSIEFDLEHGVINVLSADFNNMIVFQYDSIATVTYTISGINATITIA